jgi:hypothetical protein
MRVGLLVSGLAFGVVTWAMLALWVPEIDFVFFLRTLHPWTVPSVAGVLSVIFATGLAALFVDGQLRASLVWCGVATPLVVLGGCAALVLSGILQLLVASPWLPARIVASNVADATLLISLGLLCAAAASAIHAAVPKNV